MSQVAATVAPSPGQRSTWFAGRFGRRVVLPVALATITAALFLSTSAHDRLIYDDGEFVFDNSVVRGGLTASGLRWAFGIHGPSQYHPLTWLSHLLDVTLFGLDPGAHHAMNVLVHVAAVVLMYAFLLTATAAPLRSALVAALFAWHPTRVESVAWIAERKDLLCGLFSIVTLLCYVHYARRPTILRYTCTLAAYLLALASKPMAVTLPALLLLLDYWPLERLKRPLPRMIALEKVPFVALAIGSAVISYLCQVAAQTVQTLADVPMTARLENAVVSCVRYLRMVVLPRNLAVFYPREDWAAWLVTLCVLLLVVISAAVTIARRRYAIVGWLWFLIALIPVIGVLQVGGQAMADRYTYLPLVGIFIALVWGACAAAERAPSIARHGSWIAVALLLAFAVATALQVRHWQSDETLFSHAIAVTRGNYIAHNNLGIVYSSRNQWPEAAAQYAAALAARPSYGEALVNLAIAQDHLGLTAQAERNFRDMLKAAPQHRMARFGLANLLARSGRGTSAAEVFEQMLRDDPADVDAHVNYGAALEAMGNRDAAAAHYREALRLAPGDPDAQANLDRLLAVPPPPGQTP